MSPIQFKETFLKFSVAIKTTLSAAVGGGAAAIVAHFADPTQFAFDHAGLLKMKSIFLGGALLAVFMHFQTPPHK